jgi:hypothetical protein
VENITYTIYPNLSLGSGVCSFAISCVPELLSSLGNQHENVSFKYAFCTEQALNYQERLCTAKHANRNVLFLNSFRLESPREVTQPVIILTSTGDVALLDAGRDAVCAEIFRGFSQFLQESDEIILSRVR